MKTVLVGAVMMAAVLVALYKLTGGSQEPVNPSVEIPTTPSSNFNM